MKKILTSFLFLVSLCAFAQSGKITTSFEFPQDDYVTYLNRFLNIGMIKTIVSSDSLANKDYDIEVVTCRNGDFERKNLTQYYPLKAQSDTLNFFFIAQPLSTEKIKMQFYGPFGYEEEIDIDTSNAMLIEPVKSSGFSLNDRIPLMAFSPGIIQEFEINGNKMQGMDVCGVRYSELNPSEWYDKLGIRNYIYFELVPKEDK